MPSATRNTKTNSGNDESAPPKPKTYLKISALIPSAAAKDSTTVPISSTGASTERSSTMRISSTTTSTIGTIRLRSCLAAFCRSMLIAVAPDDRLGELADALHTGQRRPHLAGRGRIGHDRHRAAGAAGLREVPGDDL